MSDEELIYIDIMKSDWSVKVEAIGFHGKGCTEALDAVQSAIKAQTLSETLKDSYYEEEGDLRERISERT